MAAVRIINIIMVVVVIGILARIGNFVWLRPRYDPRYRYIDIQLRHDATERPSVAVTISPLLVCHWWGFGNMTFCVRSVITNHIVGVRVMVLNSSISWLIRFATVVTNDGG